MALTLLNHFYWQVPVSFDDDTLSTYQFQRVDRVSITPYSSIVCLFMIIGSQGPLYDCRRRHCCRDEIRRKGDRCPGQASADRGTPSCRARQIEQGGEAGPETSGAAPTAPKTFHRSQKRWEEFQDKQYPAAEQAGLAGGNYNRKTIMGN